MNNFTILAQLIVGLSVLYVWIFRFDNIVIEFNQYGISSLTRSIVGGSKIALSTLLIAGIWFPTLILGSALLLAFFMLAAQYYHNKVSNPIQKRIPSFILLMLCLFIAAASLDYV